MSDSSIVYTLFFNHALKNKAWVSVRTEILCINGFIKSVHSDGIYLIDAYGTLFAIPFKQIIYACEDTESCDLRVYKYRKKYSDLYWD